MRFRATCSVVTAVALLSISTPIRGVAQSQSRRPESPLGAEELKRPGSTLWVESFRQGPVIAVSSTPAVRQDFCLVESIDDYWEGDQWIPSIRNVRTCDAFGNVTQYVHQRWDGASWLNDGRTTSLYDASDNTTERVAESWVNDEWEYRSRHTFHYDSLGRMTQWVGMYWDGEGERGVITYDVTGNETEVLIQRWNSLEWLDSDRFKSEYDALGNNTYNSHETWLSGRWIIQWKWIYAYDAQGKLTHSVHNDTLAHTYTYDASGRLAEVVEQAWDGSQWVNSHRKTFAYDASGNKTAFVYQEWSDAEWIDESVRTWIYDTSGYLIESERICYPIFFLCTERVTYSYDAHGNLTEKVWQRWYNSQWRNDGRERNTWSAVAVAVEGDSSPPASYSLSQNYPNPFNPTTTFTYTLPHPADATVAVYDVLGRTVRELASGRQLAGTYEVSFDATGLPSGVYFYRLRAGDYVETQQMVVAR